MRNRILPFTSILVLASACSADFEAPDRTERVALDEQDLFVPQGTPLWNRTIPLCFATPGFAREKAIIRSAIERTWLKITNVSVSWTESCPTAGDGLYVKIGLGEHTQVQDDWGNWYWDHSSDGYATFGMRSLTRASAPVSTVAGAVTPGMTIWVEYAGTSEQSRLEYVAVHEFGHILGFGHEQDRPEPEARSCSGSQAAQGRTVGLYDPESVMNYCADVAHGYLSEGDVANARAVYGLKPALGTFTADVNGDRREDLLAVNGDGIYVLLSEVIPLTQRVPLGPTERFAWAGRWSAAFYGQRETRFADVNGDGRADALAVNLDGIYVMLSQYIPIARRNPGDPAEKFVWSGRWSGRFLGSRKTLFADVNGDRTADAVGIDDQGISVMLSSGSAFLPPERWSGSFFGTRGTWLGDVDGDGRADVVAISGGGSQVALSTGNGFTVPRRWGSDAFNARATAIRDFDGDGRADIVTINDWAVTAELSTGGSFARAVNRTTAPFYGGRESLLGDFDGDGRVDAAAVNDDGNYVMTSTGSSLTWRGAWSGPFYSQP